MNIAIIGAGHVGGALGKGWSKKGHSVVFGVRDPNNTEIKKILDECGPSVRAVSVQAAADSAEVVVLAVPWSGLADAIRSAGGLAGKIVLDCSNPVKPDLSGLELGLTTSAGEQVAAWAPKAKVVKIFNTTGADNMENPSYSSGPVTMLYCGNDEGAKPTAAGLASDLGFDPVDAGGLELARTLEPLALLWINLALRKGLGSGFAFNVVKR